MSCLTVWDPMDCSPPGSSVPGIILERILKWVATSSSRRSSLPRDWTHFFCGSCIGRWILYDWAIWEAHCRKKCSATKLCLTLHDPMDCSPPGFPVLHYLPKFTQTQVDDATQAYIDIYLLAYTHTHMHTHTCQSLQAFTNYSVIYNRKIKIANVMCLILNSRYSLYLS